MVAMGRPAYRSGTPTGQGAATLRRTGLGTPGRSPCRAGREQLRAARALGADAVAHEHEVTDHRHDRRRREVPRPVDRERIQLARAVDHRPHLTITNEEREPPPPIPPTSP